MREPIKSRDIRKGDRIRGEHDSPAMKIVAVEWIATQDRDDHTAGLANLFLLNRPTTVVDLPTLPTLGWASTAITPATLGFFGRFMYGPSDQPRERVTYGDGGWNKAAHVVEFVEAVAVPKAALDELRRDHSADLFEIDLDTAVVKFLAAVDAANGDPR